jgi:hypothetical protein
MWPRVYALAKRDVVWVPLLFAAVTVPLTNPLSIHPASTVLPLAGDTNLMIWILAWDVHALTHHPWAIFNANIFAPNHLTLAYSENCIGSALIAAPFLWTTRNPVLAMNAVALISCVLCGAGTYMLARQLGLTRPASVLAGIVFAFAPPRLLRLGQVHLAPVQWVPFGLAFLHRYFDEGRPRDAKIAALLFTLQVLTSGHAGLLLVVGTICLVGWRALRREPLRLVNVPRNLGLTGLSCLVLVVALMWPYNVVQREQGLRRSVRDAEIATPTLASYLASPSPVHQAVVGRLPAAKGQVKAVLFPGILPLLLAPIGFWAALRERTGRAHIGVYVVVLIVSIWLMLGPGYGLYTLLYHFLPGANLTRVPSRYATLGLLALAILAAAGFDRLASRLRPERRSLFAGVLGVFLAFEFNVMPLNAQTYRIDIPAADRWLGQMTKPFTVAEVPVIDPTTAAQASSRQSSYMIHSMAHWQKTVNGYSGLEPSRHTQLYRRLMGFPDDRSLASLKGFDVDYVVVHTTYYDPDEWKRVRERLTRYSSRLRLLYNDGESRVYALEK